MPKLNVETHEADQPIILIVGEKNPLIAKLVIEYSNDFKVAQIAKEIDPSKKSIYHIRPDVAHLVKNLKERIDYAIPANDDAVRSITLIVHTLANAYKEGRSAWQK